MKKAITTLALAALMAGNPLLAQHRHGDEATTGESAGTGRPAAREWTRQPWLSGRPEKGERDAAIVTPQGLAPSEIAVFGPSGPIDRLRVAYPVVAGSARIASIAPGTGNYHWLTAREETSGLVRVASTAWYFGNPGDSPKEMLERTKHELEIVPQPLPREHRSYREAEKWRFLVRFNGQPLARQPLTIETEFGSRSTVQTDADGVATVVFPRDIKTPPSANGQEESDRRQRGKFVLSAEKESDGRRYVTSFNHTYAADPERQRSLGWGLAFGALGMLAGLPLLRRRNPDDGAHDHA